MLLRLHNNIDNSRAKLDNTLPTLSTIRNNAPICKVHVRIGRDIAFTGCTVWPMKGKMMAKREYIGNAFSLGMVPRHLLGAVRLAPCDRPDTADLVSCVGHADTAAVLGVPMARISVTLQPGDVLFVAQLRGGRLPEGCVTLPEGFGFDWIRVEVSE